MTKKEIKELIRENTRLSKENKSLTEENAELQGRIERVENANLWLAERLEYRDRSISHHGYLREIDIL